MPGVVVVGAGLAGLKTVEALRTGGYAGELTLVGAEAHPPYDRPPLSKQVLRGEREPVFLRQPDVVGDLHLDLRLGVAATAVDGREVVLDGGERLPFEHAVIATGAAVRTLDAVPQVGGVFFLRTLEDCAALRAAVRQGSRVVVVGGGFIGCEVAASLRQLGAEVTVVEPQEGLLLGPLGPELAREMGARHTEAGTVVRTGLGVVGIDGDPVTAVRLDDGSSLPADVVVVGVGVTPDTGWLAGSDLALDDGVVTDEHLRTSRRGVWAAGDLARWYDTRTGTQTRAEHWTNATEMAEVVAANILGGHVVHSPVPYFWSDQYDVKIQSLGWTAGSDERRVLTVGAKAKRVVLYGRAGRLWGVAGLNAAALVRGQHQAIAEHAALDEVVGQLS